MLKRAPYHLWGTESLREFLNEYDSRVVKMTRDELINLAESMIDPNDEEPDRREDDTRKDKSVEQVIVFGESYVKSPEPEEEEESEEQESYTQLSGRKNTIRLLKKRGEWVDGMEKWTTGDLTEYKRADAVRRYEMLEDTGLAHDYEVIDSSDEYEVIKEHDLSEIDLDAAKPKVLNEILKEMGMWEKGMQFMSNEDKRFLIRCDNEADRQPLFDKLSMMQKKIKKKKSVAATRQHNARRAKEGK